MSREERVNAHSGRLALGSFWVAILLAPQLYGGVFPWSIIAIGAMCVLSLALVLGAEDRVSPQVIDALLGVFVLVWLWTCVQCMPLPRWVAAALRLQSLQSAARLESVVDYSIPLTVSLDPGATRARIMVGVGILAAFLSARILEPRRPGTVARAVAIAVALVGLSGLLHELGGARAVFGLYEPKFTNSRLLSPIMNNNHLGGFLTMGALVSIGLAVDASGRRGRALWMSIAAFCGLLVPWVVSRGAIGALVFGIGFWLWALRRRSLSPDARGAAFPLALAAVVGGAIFFALEPLARRFEQQDFSKLEMSLSGLRLLDGSAWWFGVGRGAFSSAFAAMEGSRLRITHPENILVQWSTEWGVPVATLLLVVLVSRLWRRSGSVSTATHLGLFIGLVALALQNLVDFSLEMPAIAVVAAAALGALTAPPPGASRPQPLEGRRTKRALVALSLTIALTGVLVAPGIVGSDSSAQAEALQHAMAAGDDLAFNETLKESLRQHPTDPVFPLLAATHALRNGDPTAPRWLSIAMAEAPGWGSPHLLAARWLRELGRHDQALLEIREAERRTPGATLDLLCEILQERAAVDVLHTAAPEPFDLAFYDRATRCHGMEPAFRAAIDQHILSIDPTHAAASTRQASRLVEQGEIGDAITLLNEALEEHPSSVRLWEKLIWAHLANASSSSALAALERAAAAGLDENALLVSRVRVYAALGDRQRMQTSLSRLRGLARGNPKQLAASYVFEGDLEAAADNVERALDAYRAADRTDPSSPALSKAAALAARFGLRTQAYQAYRELCFRQPDGFACQRRDQLARQLGRPPDSE